MLPFLIELSKLALCLIDGVVREERLLELLAKSLPRVHGACPLLDVGLFTPPP